MGGVERVLIAGVLVVVASVVAFLLRRRGPEAPTQPKRWPIPSQLDRDDFDGPDRPWLVLVFTSATCESCEGVVARARPLANDQVEVQDVPWQTRKDLHERYAVEAVPCTVVADAEGVVRAGWVGQVTAEELWSTVTATRDAG